MAETFWIKLGLYLFFAFVGGRIALREKTPLLKNPVILLSLMIFLSKVGMHLTNYEPPTEFSYVLLPSLGVWTALLCVTYAESLRDELTGRHGT